MAVTALGRLGSGIGTVSDTTLVVTATSAVSAGTLLVLAITSDNPASVTAPIFSLSAAGGGSWTQRGTTTGSGVNTTAGSGIWAAVFTTITTSPISNGATITTITLDSAVISRSACVAGFTGALDLLRGTVATATSTTGSPTVAVAGVVAGELLIGTIHGETNTAPTADSDTTFGSWSAIAEAHTVTGGATTNTTVGIQSKVPDTSGSQTFNATTSGDSVAFVFSLQAVANYLVVNGIADPPSGDSVGVTYIASERLVLLLPDSLLVSESSDPLTGQIWPPGKGT